MCELVSLVLVVEVTQELLDMVTQVQEWLVLISPAAVWCLDTHHFLVYPCSALQWVVVVVGLDHHYQAPQHSLVPGLLAVLPIPGTGWEGYLV